MVLTLHRPSRGLVEHGDTPRAGRSNRSISGPVLKALLVAVTVPFAILWRDTPDR